MPDSVVTDDVQLAQALARGDLDGMARLYDLYGGIAYAVALRVLGDPGRAEDAVQDGFLAIWRNAQRFDASRGSLRAWLLTTVRNRSVDYLRGRRGRERYELELSEQSRSNAAGSDPWREVSLSLEREAVRDALERLPSEQRQAIQLAYFDGYTDREVAAITQAPLGTVKGRMRLGLEKMHSYLQGRGLTGD
jgi:RNA polymerase sigma-70 factor (ECF subfamily)